MCVNRSSSEIERNNIFLYISKMISLKKQFTNVQCVYKKTGATTVALKNTKRGFSLVELLVVIAIIALLSAIVMASLASSRQKGRDAKRISEVGEIQLALELYYDGHRGYPSTTPECDPACPRPAATDVVVQLLDQVDLLRETAIPPPGGSQLYVYKGIYFTAGAGVMTECTADGRTCTSYVLGLTLERDDNPVLRADADRTLGTVFYGDSQDCLTAPVAGKTELCYDVI